MRGVADFCDSSKETEEAPKLALIVGGATTVRSAFAVFPVPPLVELTALEVFVSRYMAACDIYVAEERPAERASIVIDNNDVHAPKLVRAAQLAQTG